MAAAGAGFDFNQLAMSMGLGSKQGESSPDGANEKDMIEMVMDAAGSKLGAPLKAIGINANELLNTGIQRGLEPVDLASGAINKAAESMSLKGGFLARTLGVLLKRGEITDHTTNHMQGSDASGGGGDSGGGGGGDSGGGGGGSFADTGGGMADFGGGAPIGQSGDVATVDYGGHRYEVASMPVEAVGTLSPPNVGAIGVDLNKGDMGIG